MPMPTPTPVRAVDPAAAAATAAAECGCLADGSATATAAADFPGALAFPSRPSASEMFLSSLACLRLAWSVSGHDHDRARLFARVW